MTKKVVPFNENQRAIQETLEHIKAFLQTADENSIQSVYVRINTTGKEDGSQVQCWQSGFFWDELAMMEIELRRMMDDYYDQCMGNEE